MLDEVDNSRMAQFQDTDDTNTAMTSGDVCEGCAVLEFDERTPEETRQWLVDKLRSSGSKGGAEMIVSLLQTGRPSVQWNVEQKQEKKDETPKITGNKKLLLKMTAKKLMVTAELMGIRKQHQDGTIRELTLDDVENFERPPGADDRVDSILSSADKQRILLHAVDGLRARQFDLVVPGLEYTVNLYDGEAIVAKLLQKGIVKQVYPLHERRALKDLAVDWYKRVGLVTVPLSRIEAYFGVTVALYFAFIIFYTKMLAVPAAVGLVLLITDYDFVSSQLLFAVTNMLWLTLLLECWKRRSAQLTYAWGTFGTEQFEETRPSHHGPVSRNPVTGRLEQRGSWLTRTLIIYTVSLPIVVTCIALSVAAMFVYLRVQHTVDAYVASSKKRAVSPMTAAILSQLPSSVYALVIFSMNTAYRWLATALTDFENHRVQSTYDNHMIVKLALFTLVNSFVSLFYVAFVQQDMQLLRTQLSSLLITTQLISQCQKVLLPYVVYKWHKRTVLHKYRKAAPLSVEALAELDGGKDVYTGELDDYMDLVVQFGHVFLFSSVFPASALCALINNVVEIRSDAFRLCWVLQRPWPRPTVDIGAWQVALDVLSVTAIAVNCALVYLSPAIKSYTAVYGSTAVLLVVVGVEHLLVLVRCTVAYLIPDVPAWVERARARQQYVMRELWRKEAGRQSVNHLRRIFREHVD